MDDATKVTVDSQLDDEVFDEHEPEVAVKVRKDGVVKTYFVREFAPATQTNTSGMAQYSKILDKNTVVKPDGTVVNKVADGFHADVIGLCLYDEQGNRVPKAMIENWGPRLKLHLFGLVQQVNGLTKKTRDREGKDSSSTDSTGGG